MLTSLNYKTFFKKLGNLYFAIAAADQKITAKEKQSLEEIIQFQWKHTNHTTDRFGTDAAYLILFQFETLADGIVNPEHAYESFAHYYSEHMTEMDEPPRRKIFQSAVHIAESVRGVNHSELDYLLRLKNLLAV